MKPTIIGIAGGTASGKTTIAKKLFNETKNLNSVSLIRMDDYYYNIDKIPHSEQGNSNYDHPDSYDIELLTKHISMLKSGQDINKPIYDFVTHSRQSNSELVKASNVIIIEGIMSLAIKQLRDMFDIKIFVDTPDDIRFIRRLKRDIEDRGRTVESVVNQYLDTVRPMHIAFVEPSKQFADIIIPEGGYNTVALDLLMTKIETLTKENSYE